MADEIIDPMIEDLLAELLEEVKRQPPFKRLPSEPRRKKIGRMLKSLRVRFAQLQICSRPLQLKLKTNTYV